MPIDNHAVEYNTFYWGMRWLTTAHKNPANAVPRNNAYKRFIETGLRREFAYEFSQM